MTTKKMASELFQVGIATVYRWVKQKKDKGHIEPHRRAYVYRKIDYDLLAQSKSHRKELGEYKSQSQRTLTKIFKIY